MSAFDEAYRFTLQQEGGFVLSTLQHDRGGMTYAGISRVMQPQWPGWALIDAGKDAPDAMQDLVRQFYFARFWQRMGLENVPARLAVLAFDFGVNSGNQVAIKRLQRIAMVQDDGELGPKTVAAIRAADPNKLAIRYVAARIDYLDDLDTWSSFGRGWMHRIINLMNYLAQ